MNNFALELPYNSVSFGQISTLLSREIWNLKLNPCIFPIGNTDISCQTNISQDFIQWLQNSLNSSTKKHSRKTPIFKLWHLPSSLQSYSDKQILYSFYELDNPTEEEINIVKNNHKVIFSNDYTVNIFKNYGCDNVIKIPLAFDKYNFSVLNKTYFTDGRITFNFCGKVEITRKRTAKVIQSWIKKFGNNTKYFLNCAIWNVHITPEQNQQIINEICGGQRYFNIQFLGYMPSNGQVNDYYNSGDIMISMGTEGYGLPLFNSLCLGKHAVALNCAGHKEYCNNENTVLVNPCAKIPVYDNMFFRQGQPYNQGSVYDFNEDEFISACELAINRVQKDKINHAGLKLQNEFNSEKFANQIIEEITK